MPTRNQLPDVRRSGSLSRNPIRELNRLQSQIDRMFDDFISSPVPSFFSPTSSWMEMAPQGVLSPACDIEETDSHYLVNFDLPGVKKEDVKIELRDNQLTVSGERQEEHKEGKGSRLSEERYYGSFMRSFALPSGVDPDKVEASYENGVLSLAIPKSEAAKPKQIQIKEGKRIEQKTEGKKTEQKVA